MDSILYVQFESKSLIFRRAYIVCNAEQVSKTENSPSFRELDLKEHAVLSSHH